MKNMRTRNFEDTKRLIKTLVVLAVICCVGCLFFTQGPVENYVQAKTADTEAFGAYCRYLLEQGVYAAPSQFEAMFLSAVHTDEEIEQILRAAREIF